MRESVHRMEIDPSIQAAFRHHQAGRLAEAEAGYMQALAAQPKNASVLQALARVHAQTGRWSSAISIGCSAVSIEPRDAAHHASLGEIYRQLGKLEEAIGCFAEAARLQPGNVRLHFDLGLTLRAAGRVEEAIAAQNRAIETDATFIDAWRSLGDCLGDKGEWESAAAAYRRGSERRPQYAELHNALSAALLRCRQLDSAIASANTAIDLKPELSPAYYNLGLALHQKMELDRAISAYRRAVELNPQYAIAHNNLGNVYLEIGRIEDAISCFDRARSSNPNAALVDSNRLYALHFRTLEDPAAIFQEHVQWGRAHGQIASIAPHGNRADPDRRLRVGYVSPDFRQHSVASFIQPLLANHDPSEVELFCYGDVQFPDSVTEKIKAVTPNWRDIRGKNDASAEALIRGDGIDILVDLSGHTAGNRLRLFARKPAPIQVTYLGYPDTTGMSAMDYRISDALADPSGRSENFHTETLLRLSPCFLCYQPPEDAPDPSEVPVRHNGYFTFGCFSAMPKIQSPLIHLWAEILRSVPDSRMIIKFKGLSSTMAREFLLGEFQAAGIERDRLELRGHTATRTAHLGTYRELDIALDTFPYNGTTTTCEALWMWVPVLTLSGRSHASRVGESILTTVGLSEFITRRAAYYVDHAVSFANDRSRLANIRQNVRQLVSRSPLIDGRSFARRVEESYRQIWRDWCASKSEA